MDNVLMKASELGIIDLVEIQSMVEYMTDRQYLDSHSFDVWKGTNDYWYTYVLDKGGNRRLLKRKNRKDLDKSIIGHYKDIEERPSVKMVFMLWINDKLKSMEISRQSYDRYSSDYNRFFKGTFFENINVCDVTDDYVEEFLRFNLERYTLSVKTFSGLRIILSGTLKFAKKKKYTSYSISGFFADYQLPKRALNQRIKDKSLMVFGEDDAKKIVDYCDAHADIWNLGIELCFLTGLRVGELSALRKSDFNGKTLKVLRTEIKEKGADNKWHVIVSDIPKTAAGEREIILPAKAKNVINKILDMNHDNEYLFVGRIGSRIRGNTFNKRLDTICKQLSIPHRTMHKIRATYATKLLDNNVSEALICSQMGHTDISTTRKYYYFCNKNDDVKREQIEKAICF